MSEGREDLPARRCPSCGGLMSKPAASSFYWHAEANHPRCAITNIGEPPAAEQQAIEAVMAPETPRSSRTPEMTPRRRRQQKNRAV
jgi:hypothetical protein